MLQFLKILSEAWKAKSGRIVVIFGFDIRERKAFAEVIPEQSLMNALVDGYHVISEWYYMDETKVRHMPRTVNECKLRP